LKSVFIALEFNSST